MTELSKIASNYRTDKGVTYTNSHCYTEIYDQYFKKLRDENRKVYIMEIGIQYGHDLLMINEYFKGNCEIFGYDIDTTKLQFDISKYDNIHISEVDINDREYFDEIFNQKYLEAAVGIIPYFDIIIDDGSHRSYDIINGLSILHKQLNKDGIYIIEDLHSEDAIDALSYLNFGGDPYGIPDSLEIHERLKSSIIYNIYDTHCKEYPVSKCAILTFK